MTPSKIKILKNNSYTYNGALYVTVGIDILKGHSFSKIFNYL